MNEAINSPAGELAESLFNFPEIKGLADGTHLPIMWLETASALLDLGVDNARFVMVCFMQRLRWFHDWATEWTDEKILNAASSDNTLTVDAYWAGIAVGTRTIPSFQLFQEIKSGLLEKFSSPVPMEKSRYKNLLSLIMAGWLNRHDSDRWISDSEFASVLAEGSNELRESILWQLWRRSSEEVENPPFDWDVELVHFFESVWPRTRAAKSGLATERILEIALANADRLARLASVILPRLGQLKRGGFCI